MGVASLSCTDLGTSQPQLVIDTSIRLALRANLCYKNRTLQMNKSSNVNRTLQNGFPLYRQTCSIHESLEHYILINTEI